MSYTADLDFSIKQCTALEADVRVLLQQAASAQGNENRSFLRAIHQKIARARDFVTSIQMDVSDLRNPDLIRQYTREWLNHDQIVKQLEDSRHITASTHQESHARSQKVTPHELMRSATELQKVQINSLDHALHMISQICTIGAGTLSEIGRQKEKVNQISTNLHEMDSKLGRTRKIFRWHF
jgi:hypothetical protein